MQAIIRKYNETSLILRILIGAVIGALLAFAIPNLRAVNVFGELFINALKAIAPSLVLLLVASSLCQSDSHVDSRFGIVIFLYLFSTLLAALTSVIMSFAFPQTITLAEDAVTVSYAPGGFGDILEGIFTSIVQNPIAAVVDGNYLGILFWAIIIGMALHKIASQVTQTVLANLADAVTDIVRGIVNLAPFGIMGVVYKVVSQNGFGVFVQYGNLIILLIGTMLIVEFVVNPVIVGLMLGANPYPLVLRCMRESGISAFFTRSSAANIPVNMELCRKLGLDREMYSVSIPLGATINMDGAAVTITIMTLVTANTLGIKVALPSAILLSFLAALGACGTSGVTGGSLLLIPMACSLFGIPDSVSMQVVAVGFIIGVIQDSMETAINSSSDALFTATAEYRSWKKRGKSLPKFLGGMTEVEMK